MSELDLFASAGDGLDPSHFGLTDDGRAFVEAPAFARSLKYSTTQKALQVVDADEQGDADRETCSTSGVKQVRRMKVIYEDGIWELIFRSTLPSAKSIKSRVKAILRQLRETGVVDVRDPREMTEIERAKQHLEMTAKYVATLERNAELEPKAQAYDRFMTAEGDYSIGTVAQMLGTGQNRLFARLRDEHILITGGARHNTPYQQYLRHFRVVTRTYTDNDGAEKASHTTFVRPSGVDFIRKVLRLQDLTK